MLVVRRESPDQPEVIAFLKKADERVSFLYPGEGRHGLSVSALLAAGVRFFVARVGDHAIGCSGYIALPAYAGELKRLFVDLDARGHGVGQSIVLAIERAAVQEQIQTMYLEAGVKSLEAIRLYKRLGYRECGPFASYALDPLSIFMEKRLRAS
jgi:putative acetyltransferase